MNDIEALKLAATKVDGELARRLNHLARCLERVPSENIRVSLASGFVLKTSQSACLEDLPWDAYIVDEHDFLVSWADGFTELEAIKKVIAKAGLA